MTFEELFAIDRSNMFRLLRDFPDQVREAVTIGKDFKGKKLPSGIRQIVLTGMGGSAIAGDLLQSYLGDSLRVPLVVNRQYTLPRYTGTSTLVIVSSYSGNTEETINAYHEAVRRKARILCITSGGRIGKMARAKRHMLITLPGGLPPRAALGYVFFPLLMALSRLGLAGNRAKEITETLGLLEAKSREYGTPDPSSNRALQLASLLRDRIAVIYAGADRLSSVATRWRGQFAENAKALAWTHTLPEMNHNEIVGWELPQLPASDAAVFFLRDRGDHARIQRRFDLTKQFVAEKTPNLAEVRSEGASPLARMFSLIYLGDWISYYLAILRGVDPTPVAVIDQLKEKLGKS